MAAEDEKEKTDSAAEKDERNNCIGSSFDEYLKEEGIFNECEAVAVKRTKGPGESPRPFTCKHRKGA